MKKLLFLLVIFAFSNSVISQNLNAYKYAYVPSQFTGFKEKDKFRLSTLTKLFMLKYGFEAYSDTDTAPFDFTNVNCNKVYVDLIKDNSLFLTKVKIILKDCKGKILFTSKEGTSKEKELRVAYNQALREAFTSFEKLNHQYDEKAVIVKTVETVPVVEVAQPKKEIQQTKEETPVVTNSTQLFARPIQNGFQLVNSQSVEVMKLYKTSVKDLFTAFKGAQQGVFVSKNNEWFFEYYQNDQLVSEKVDVKF